MRILHTADWHIGQTLNGWSREYEHQCFLAHLRDLIAAERIDALLVAGDVFDGINPSGESQRLLYQAIADFLRVNPRLQIVMTSGNHDPAQRLEAPEALLAALGVHVIGTLRREGPEIDIDHHLIGLRDASGELRAHVLAVPFLRQADLPGLQLSTEAAAGAEPAITAAARALHLRMTDAAKIRVTKNRLANAHEDGLPLLAMGHLTCSGAFESEGAERRILIGGEHAVPTDIFPPALDYVALGHLHRPQSLDGGRVRYCGSPFPLSAAEIGYAHGVTLIDLDQGLSPRHIPLPRPVPVYRLPASGAATLEKVIADLRALELAPDCPRNAQAFVYVSLLADRPVTQISAEIDAVLETMPLRLAGRTIQRPESASPVAPPPPSLADTTPEQLFLAAFAEVHGVAPAPAHLAAFREAFSEI